MLRKHGANHFVFEQNMILIRPLLNQLTKYTKIVWLYQYPTVEYYGNINASNTDVVSQKLHHYNQIVRSVLS
jgi:hypothetical protein